MNNERGLTLKVEMPEELRQNAIKSIWFQGAQAGFFLALIVALAVAVFLKRNK